MTYSADQQPGGLDAGGTPIGADYYVGEHAGDVVKFTHTQLMTAILALLVDTDGTAAANSDSKVASQKAMVTYVAARITAGLASADVMIYKGATDCSANPNYPAADAGAVYIVSVTGKIGGASGISVEAGDLFVCKSDATASGNQATVGSSWDVVQTNLIGAALTSGNLSQFAPTTSAQLAGVMTDETGSGALVFANAPALVNPVVGTQSAGDNSTKAASTAYVDSALAAGVGAVTGLEFTSSTTTTDSDPGTGTVRWNNSTQASATALYIDNTDADATSLATLWGLLAANTLLRISLASNQDVWQLWRATASPIDGTGYYKFPVSLVASEGSSIANGVGVRIEVAPVLKSANLHVLAFSCSDLSTAITAGTNKGGCINPFSTAFNVAEVVADLATPQVSGSAFTVDVNESGTTILSTKLIFDNTENSTETAATPRVISDASIAPGARISADVDAIGDGTAKGLTVYVIGWPS